MTFSVNSNISECDAFRYMPPAYYGQHIIRTSALAALVSECPAVLLKAPAGSGKTSLMLAYYQQLKQSQRTVYWLNLDEQDDDVAMLEQHWMTAFNAPCDISASSEQSSTPVYFVDGLEKLSNPVALALAERLIIRQAGYGKIYAAIKTLHSQVLHEAKLRGIFKLLDFSSFQASNDDARKILGELWSNTEIEQLNRFVGGWFAGLRLLENAKDSARVQLNLTSDSVLLVSDLNDYFTDVLCKDLSTADMKVLMDLSVLDRFNASLLAALPDIHCEWWQIREWAESDLLLDKDKKAPDWMVFNPAFGCYLRHLLRHHNPSRYDALKQFAANWFAQQGLGVEAVRHAVGINEMPTAARIIEQAGGVALYVNNAPNVKMEDFLPAELAAEFPLLFLAQVYYRIRVGRLHDAQYIFNEAKNLTQSFSFLKDKADTEVVSAWADMFDVLLNVCHDDQPVTELQIAKLEAQFHKFMYSAPVLSASISSVLAFTYLDISQYEAAADICSLGLNAQNIDNNATMFIRIQQTSIAIAQDSIEKALMHIEHAQRLASIECSNDSYEVLVSQIMRAILHYENNELEEAAKMLSQALANVRNINGWVRIYAEAFSTAASIACIRQGYDAAEKIIVEAEAFARERKLVRLANFMQMARMRELIRAGDLREASKVLQSAQMTALLEYDELSPYVLVQQMPALLLAAQLMLELSRPRDALLWLDKLNKEMLKNADNRLRFSFRVLAMRAALALRRFNAAAEHLQAAVDIARKSGIVHRALEESTHLTQAFDSVTQTGRVVSARTREWINKILRPADGSENAEGLRMKKSRSQAMVISGNCVLSPRESEIIALISEGFSNKEIANRLGITDGTVKTHRKKIYEKLEVSTRSQAIERARELLII